jgi:riboflavin biosynthesis pyrimidine reductase
VISFGAFSDRKTREAEAARLTPLCTLDDRSDAFDGLPIGNAWSHTYFGGPFHLPLRAAEDVPLVSLVFVQSQEGNTGADNPEDLGGGPVDKHLIYEGLSRVAVDAVLAGAKTAEGEETFFSVWNSELVALRRELGLSRHPAQIVVTGTGCIDLDRSLVFNVPDVPVYLVSTPGGCEKLAHAASQRPSVELVPMQGEDLRAPLAYLRRERRIRRVSAIGGRTTASGLIDGGLVQDLCLTTTARSAGQPDTPFYVGKHPPGMRLIVRKQGTDPSYPIVFEHFAVISPPKKVAATFPGKVPATF